MNPALNSEGPCRVSETPQGNRWHEYCLLLSLSPQRRSVVSDDDQFGFALTQGLECLPESQAVFARFHYQRQTRVDALNGLFL
jgi:hypothetical protein